MVRCQLCRSTLRFRDWLRSMGRPRPLVYHSIAIGGGQRDRHVRWLCNACEDAANHHAIHWARPEK
jgi:hypothetical protein